MSAREVQLHTAVHVYWGASGLPTIGTHKLLRIPPLVPTSHPAHNVTSSTRGLSPEPAAAEEEFIGYLGKTNHFAAEFTHFASHTSRRGSHLSVFRYVRV